MNLLLLSPDELDPGGLARLTGRRLLHARQVLRAAEGDVLRVGVLGGRVGTGAVERLSDDELVLRVELRDDPPPRPGVTLLLAIPRPKALRKLLPAAAALGVDRLVLLNAARVEKSYFESAVLEEAELTRLLSEGLEQARDTRLPVVQIERLFRPFVEDRLDALLGPSRRLVAHPTPASPPCAAHPAEPTVLAIGPEGGWVPFELDLLRSQGFAPLSLGPRILRTEVAVPYALGLLSALR